MAGLSFKKGKETTYPWPITVKLPSQATAGRFTDHSFIANFKVLPTSESRAMVAEADRARDAGRSGDAMDLDKGILREVMQGWSGLEEEFTAENLEECMDNPFFLTGLINGYRKSISGEGAQARTVKN
ncbi:phage tail assembly chaperone [Niveispirillum sp. KHB5.9]|uniref:phage tail assembly chaperone n=1 Tax=Niveispirillum sp. KHB5.9 TaxID=3400269 RepID=UPI003A86F465